MRRAVVIFGAALLCLLMQAASASAVTTGTFPASGGLGAIPDGTAVTPPSPGPFLDVTFDVTGFPFGVPSDVAVTMTGSHTQIGDLDVQLIAPSGIRHTIFSRTGATTAGGFGHPGNFAGPYTFSDSAPTSPSWWTASGPPLSTSSSIPSGSYRASDPGGAGSTGANNLITPAFSSLDDVNGEWVLRFRDLASADVGSVTAASVTVTTPPMPVPALASTDPASGANNNAPKIKGTLATNSAAIKIYTSAGCTGAPVGTGSAIELAGAGIPVNVADNTTTQFRATATDEFGNVSACSAPISYQEVTPVVTPPPNPPDTAACDAAKAKQATASTALDKAKAKAKKAKGKAKKKKAKAKVKKAKASLKEADAAVASAC